MGVCVVVHFGSTFFFLFWNVRNVKLDLMVTKNGNTKRKTSTKKRINISLKGLSVVLSDHGRQGLLSFF